MSFRLPAVLEPLIRQLVASENLTEADVCQAIEDLVDERVGLSLKVEFLSQLAVKGETVSEIAAFARELRRRAIQPRLNGALRNRPILDVVGTGGDRLSTFNISTTVALIAAAAGVLVAKHGNRASTSLIGSADVIEALGIPFELGPEDAVRSLEQHGFAFFFAPRYHPAFKHIIPARRVCAERGRSTIFNFLGPLLNPVQPSAMLVGVPRPELCQSLAEVLPSLGVRRAMVVCGSVQDETGGVRYLDELSPLGPSVIAEFYQEHALTSSSFVPEAFPIQPASLADLRGGDRELNATIIRSVLIGKERGPKRDAVLLNAAAALLVAGAATSLTSGWDLAAEVIDSGQAWTKLQQLQRN